MITDCSRYLSMRLVKTTRRFLILAIVTWLILFLPFPSWADFASGFRAYARGDYDTALKEFRRLADRGDISAQYNLGLMYDKGHGVPQDDKEALRWYRMAAGRESLERKSTWGMCTSGAKTLSGITRRPYAGTV